MKKIITISILTGLSIITVVIAARFTKIDSTLVAGFLSVIATVFSPFIVIAISEHLTEKKEIRARKLNIFKSLMSTRGEGLSREHVNALNLIELEFNANIPLEKEVVDAWQLYLHHLGKNTNAENWEERRQDFHAQLMLKMAQAMGYDFNETRIRTGHYIPNAFSKKHAIEDGLLGVLNGDKPIVVTTFDRSDK